MLSKTPSLSDVQGKLSGQKAHLGPFINAWLLEADGVVTSSNDPRT